MFWNTIHLHFIRSEGLATIKKEFTVAAIREDKFWYLPGFRVPSSARDEEGCKYDLQSILVSVKLPWEGEIFYWGYNNCFQTSQGEAQKRRKII